MSSEFSTTLETFGIDEADFNNIKSELEGIIKEKYDDPNVLEKVYEILKDGVTDINDRIDNLTKSLKYRR